MAGMTIYKLCRQLIDTFFEDDTTLLSIPAWLRDYLRYERDGG